MGKQKTEPAKKATAPDPRQGTDEANKAAAGTSAPASAPAPVPAPSKRKRAAFDEEPVSMSVHTGFNLTDDAGIIHRYEVGIQDVPKSHSEHWYMKVHADSNED